MLRTNISNSQQKYNLMFNKELTQPLKNSLLTQTLTQLKVDREKVEHRPALLAVIHSCIVQMTKFNDYISGVENVAGINTPLDELKYITDLNKNLFQSINQITNGDVCDALLSLRKPGEFNYHIDMTLFCKLLIVPNPKQAILPPYMVHNVSTTLEKIYSEKMTALGNPDLNLDTYLEKWKNANNLLDMLKSDREDIIEQRFFPDASVGKFFDKFFKRVLPFRNQFSDNQDETFESSKVIAYVENLLKSIDQLPLSEQLAVLEKALPAVRKNIENAQALVRFITSKSRVKNRKLISKEEQENAEDTLENTLMKFEHQLLSIKVNELITNYSASDPSEDTKKKANDLLLMIIQLREELTAYRPSVSNYILANKNSDIHFFDECEAKLREHFKYLPPREKDQKYPPIYAVPITLPAQRNNQMNVDQPILRSVNPVNAISENTDEDPEFIRQCEIIQNFLEDETNNILADHHLTEIQKTNPALAVSLLQYEKLQKALIPMLDKKNSKRDVMRKDRENIYQNFIGWEVGVLLHRLSVRGLEIASFVIDENFKATSFSKTILEFALYGWALFNSGKLTAQSNRKIQAYGKTSVLFARELLRTTKDFFGVEENLSNEIEQRAFQERLIKLVNSQITLLLEHPDKLLAMKKLNMIVQELKSTLNKLHIPLLPEMVNLIDLLEEKLEFLHQNALIEKYLQENNPVFFHKELKNLTKPNPELTASLVDFERLRHVLVLMQDVKNSSKEAMKTKRHFVYQTALGWEIGTKLRLFNSNDTANPLPENVKAKPFYDTISDLQKHGESLCASNQAVDKAYGQATTLFARELLQTAHHFFDDTKKVSDKAEQKAFQERFNQLINSKKALLSEHPDHTLALKQFIRNIIRGLILTLSLIGIPLYIGIKKENPFKLFLKPKTKARKLLDKIEIRKVMPS